MQLTVLRKKPCHCEERSDVAVRLLLAEQPQWLRQGFFATNADFCRVYLRKEVHAMEDEQIVALYWDRDEAAISRTEEKYDRYLTKIAMNILASREDSRESVNDTYLAAWNSMPTQRPQVLSAYLAKLTRRISIDRFRYRSRDKRRWSEYALSLEELGDCVSGGNTTEEILNARLLADAIGVFLRLQSEECRTVFLGRYYFLDSLREIAGYCGMTESKVKTLLYRTRIALKEYLEKEGFDL